MKKKITAALFSLQSKSSIWIAEAMKKYFDEVDHFNIKKVEVSLTSKGTEVLYDGKPIKEYDCLHVKGSFRYVDLLRAISAQYEGKCFNPIEPNAYTIGNDKLLTQIKLQPFNIPMPTTYLSPSTEAGKKILEKIKYPIVMKLPSGTHGKGVMFADSFASASSFLDALESLRQPFLIQEYLETGGIDTRAIVIGDKVVASMQREAIEGEKRANIHAGGKGKPVILDSHTKKLAVDAAKIIGAGIAAVDLLDSVKGPMIIELNLSPGLQGITAYTKIDVADKIAKYLFTKTTEFVANKAETGSKEVMKEINMPNGDKNIAHEVVTNIDFRGNRILLPEIVTKMTDFNETDEFVIKIKNNGLSIKRFDDPK